MEKCQRSAWVIEKFGKLTAQQMAQRARDPVLPALERSNSVKKRTELLNRYFHAAIYIRGYAVRETRPEPLTLPDSVLGQRPRLDVCLDQNRNR